jgi:hypothetical protein
MLVLSSAALARIGMHQGNWLTRWGARITLPYVPGIPSRFAQRPYEVTADNRGARLTKPRRLFASSVRLVHMRGGTAAIPEA